MKSDRYWCIIFIKY